MKLAFLMLTGLSWGTAYVLAIRTGIRDRSYPMPIVALATNISWEFQFAFVRPFPGPLASVMRAATVIWFLLDCALLYTVLRFGPREFPFLKPAVFRGCCVVLLVMAYEGMELLSIHLDAGSGTFTAFGSNVAMSGMFLAMLAGRGSSRGQSLGIATAKLVGTAAAGGAWYLQRDQYPSALAPYCAVTSFVLDLAYLLALALVIRSERNRGSCPRESDGHERLHRS